MSKSESRQRPKQVLIRLTDSEHAALSALAEQSGLALADFVRAQALDEQPIRVRRRPTADRAALAKVLAGIGQIGNNVNQIARALNRERSPDAEHVTEAMKAVVEMRDAVLAALGIVTPERKR